MSEFTKESLSVDKLQYSLLEPDFMAEVAKVLTFGANKYSRENWKKCQNPELYMDALIRHIEAYRRGEQCDPETLLHHFAHAACNLMFLYWMEYNEPKQ